MNLDLTGQIALVTGASRGIGQAIADALMQAGAKVIGTATTADGAAAIDEVVTIGIPCREAGRGAGFQDLFARIGDQHHLALDHIDEFVLPRVPVAVGRPAAGWQVHDVDTEIPKPEGVADAPPHALFERAAVDRRVGRSLLSFD